MFQTLLCFWSCWMAQALAISPSIHNTNSNIHNPNNNSHLRVIVVGGSSGMGKAAASQILQQGGKVLLVSRSQEKLEKARDNLIQECHLDKNDDDSISLVSVDVTQEDEVAALAQSTLFQSTAWNGLVVTAAGKAPHGPVASLPPTDARGLLDSKLWGAYYCAHYWGPHLDTTHGAAVVFCAGVLNRRPGLNCAPLAMANGALEGLTRTLALEWGPLGVRVNCLSPGFCDTERFDHMDPTRKQAMLENTAASLPLQTVGQPRDMGEAIFYLLTAPFCTGVVLDVDGGHGIRQYANPTKDPMRQGTKQ